MGSITKRDTRGGVRYDARYRAPDGKQVTKTFQKRRDAAAFLAKVEAAKNAGDYIDPRAGKVTLGSFFEEWATRQQWAPRTEVAMRLAVDSSPWRDAQLRRITREGVEQWVADMSHSLAPTTVRTRVSNVRQVLRAAVAAGHLPRDPSDGVKLPRLPSRHEVRIPSTATVAKVIAELPEPHATMALVAASAGLRLGEVAGLQAGDVDDTGGVLRVRRQAAPAPGGGMMSAPVKSRSSVRDVPIPAELVARLVEAAGDRPESAWLFPSPATDGPMHPSTMSTVLMRAAERAGVEVRWHELRHFYASGLIRAGLDPVTVAHALGHASPSVTMTVYAHLWPDSTDRTRVAAGALVAAIDDTVRGMRDAQAPPES